MPRCLPDATESIKITNCLAFYFAVVGGVAVGVAVSIAVSIAVLSFADNDVAGNSVAVVCGLLVLGSVPLSAGNLLNGVFVSAVGFDIRFDFSSNHCRIQHPLC